MTTLDPRTNAEVLEDIKARRKRGETISQQELIRSTIHTEESAVSRAFNLCQIYHTQHGARRPMPAHHGYCEYGGAGEFFALTALARKILSGACEQKPIDIITVKGATMPFILIASNPSKLLSITQWREGYFRSEHFPRFDLENPASQVWVPFHHTSRIETRQPEAVICRPRTGTKALGKILAPYFQELKSSKPNVA